MGDACRRAGRTARKVVVIDIGRFKSQLCILDLETGTVADHLIIIDLGEFERILSPLRSAIDHVVVEVRSTFARSCSC